MSNNPTMSDDLQRVNSKEMTTEEFMLKYMPKVAIREQIRSLDGDEAADSWYEQE